jgi:rhodanese-related sulfurtransferase
MKVFLQMAAMAALSLALGIGTNFLFPEPLPVMAEKSQFAVEVTAPTTESSDILRIWESGEAFFVDARSEEAFNKGHIPGAFSVPYKQFEEGTTPETVDVLPREQKLIIYCDGADCHASQVVYDALLNLGFQKDMMEIFHGGWTDWNELGGEVESFDE